MFSCSAISCVSFFGVLILILAALFVFFVVIRPVLIKRSPQSKFLEALHRDDMEAIEELVNRHPKLVNRRDEFGVPLLFYTAHWNKFAVLEFLVSRGADIFIEGEYNETILHIAATKGNLAMIRFLVERGSDITKRNEFGQTALERASFGGKDAVEYLLSRGAQINEKSYSGNTALSNAVNRQDIGTVEFLIASGADVNSKDDKGETPLHISSDLEISALLISKGADVNALDRNNHSPLHKALEMRLIDISDLLLKSGARVFLEEELSYVVMKGDSARTAQILKENPRILAATAMKKKGWTVLHEAAIRGNMEIAGQLIAAGADVNAETGSGVRPLHEAALSWKKEVAELLITHGALIDARTEIHDEREHGVHGGETALHYAAENGDREMYDLLVSRGADVTLTDASGNTAGSIMRKRYH